MMRNEDIAERSKWIGEPIWYTPAIGSGKWYRGEIANAPRHFGQTLVVSLCNLEASYSNEVHGINGKTTVFTAPLENLKPRLSECALQLAHACPHCVNNPCRLIELDQ